MLEFARISGKGLKEYSFDEEMWQDIVDNYNGIIPIIIKAMPEGSVVYPNEPVVIIENVDNYNKFGELAAYFESKLLQVWSSSERLTQDRHFYDKVRNLYKENFTNLTQEEINFYASIILTDFGDRAGMNKTESEDQGLTALYTFGGTDTFAGAYQAWKNSDEKVGLFSSVYALAHRNVQAYDKEDGAYNKLYDISEDGDFMSMVNDCYHSKTAVTKYHLPLALKSKELNNGKIVISRPDSNVAIEEILFIIETAIKNDLYELVDINGEKWYSGTTLHFIEGDGLNHENILSILKVLIDKKYIPWTWGLFGMGGGQRNNLKRDDLSAKYALCSIGLDNKPVVKFSDTIGKTTLPGPFKVLRSEEALKTKVTIVNTSEEGEDAMTTYYNGNSKNIKFPLFDNNYWFDWGMTDNFNIIKERSHYQFDTMPKTLKTEENHNYPASFKILDIRRNLLKKYSPEKNINDY